MNRDTEQQLDNVGVTQHDRFDANAWQQIDGISPEQKACAMLLLANARWYGRLQELRDLVSQSMPAKVERLSELATKAGFNCGLFAQRLQAQLWQSTEPKR
jgi:hypothetical protein